MRKWCDPLPGTAPGLSQALLGALLFSTLACGPRTVPYPERPATWGAAGQGVAPRAGSLAYAGAGMSATGAGRTALPGAGTGSVLPPGPVAATSGSTFPVAGDAGVQVGGGGVAGSPPPAAGSSEPPTTAANFDAGTDPARNNVQAGELCARLAVIQCAAEAHCCLAPTRSNAACQSATASACREQLYLDVISQNPITGFDRAFAAQVFTELEDRSSRCDLAIATWSITPQGLRGILKGTLDSNASCKPPATALMDKPSQAAALASCKNIDTHACLPKSLLGDWTCAAKSGVGANCITDDNCQSGLYCKNPQMNPLGKCAQRVALGATCINGTDCQSMFCKSGTCVAPEQQLAFCGE